MVTAKNFRITTAVKVLSATMPTKNAAIHSIESMKRSITFLRTGAGGPVTTPSRVTSGVAVMESPYRLQLSSWPGLSRPSTSFVLRARFETWMPGTRPGMTNSLARAQSSLKPRAIFLQRRLQIGVDRGGVAAGLGHRGGPTVVQRLDGA